MMREAIARQLRLIEANSLMFRGCFLAIAASLVASVSVAQAQSTYTISGSTTSWLTGSWKQASGPGNTWSYPGTISGSNSGNNDFAILNGLTGSSFGIAFTTTNNSFSLGTLSLSNNQTSALTIGNSSSTANGTLYLNGNTVNGYANTIISDFGTKRTTISGSLSSETFTIALVNTNNAIQLAASNGNKSGTSTDSLAISANITETAAGHGLTIIGNGTSTAATDNQLFLSGTNNFSGGITLGDANAGTTYSGAELDITGANALPTTGTITVNTNSALVISTSGTFGGGSQNLSLFGGGAGAITQNSAFDFEQAATWSGNITLNGAAKISVTGGSNNATLAGLITGSGTGPQLQKTAGGTLHITGPNNSNWGTDVTNGVISVESTGALGTGSLTVDTSGHNAAIAFNNATQSIGSLLFVAGGSGNITLNGTILQVSQTTDSTFGNGSVSITGTGGLALLASSTNTLTLGGANAYTGGTTIGGGTLALGASGALASAGAVTISGGTLSVAAVSQTVGSFTQTSGTLTGSTGGITLGSGNYSLSGGYSGITLSGSAGATLGSSGSTLTLASGNAYSGATTINGGTIVLTNSAGSAFGSNASAVTVISGSTLASGTNASISQALSVNSGGSVLVGNSVAGGTFTINGGLTISGGSTFSYTLGSGNSTGLIKDAGSLSIANGATLNVGGSFGSGGTYNLINFDSDTGNTSFSSITGVPAGYAYSETFSGNTLELLVTLNTVTWSATTSSLADGPGMWTNGSGTNFYTGSSNQVWDNTAGTNVVFGAGGTGGVVSLGSNITVGLVTFAPVGSTPYTINGNGFNLTISAGVVANESATIAAPVTISTSESWSAASGKLLTVSGNIGEAGGAQALTFSGPGTVLLSGNNNYSGGSYLGGGTVQINSATSLGNSSGTATISAGTLELVSSVTSSRNFALSNAASTIYVDSGSTYTIAGTIRDGATPGTLNVTGPGTLALANAANSYSGGTVVSGGGALLISADGNLGASTAGLTINGATLDVTGSGFSSGRNVTIGSGGATFDIASGGTLTLTSGLTVGSSTLTKVDTGTLDVTGTTNLSNFAGTVNVSGGTLTANVASGNVNAALNVASGATMVLNGGTVNFGDGTASVNDTITGTLILAGTRFNLNGSGSVIGGPGTIEVLNNNTVISNASGTQGGTIATQIVLNPNNTASFTAYIGPTKPSGQLNLTISGAISGNANVDFANGSGGGGNAFMLLSAQSSWTGNTLIDTGGTVQLGINNALPTGSAVSFNNFSGGNASVLDLNGYNQQVASLATGAGGGGTTITNNMGSTISTLTISGSSGSTTYSGVITDGNGQIALYKSGASTQALTGANGYSGGTVIAGGVLVAGGSSPLGYGDVTVSSATLATLPGAYMNGNVTVASGATIAPGYGSAGQLTIGGDLAAYSGTTFSYALGGTSTSSEISVNNLTLSSGVALNLSNIGAGTYQLISFAGDESGSFSSIYGVSGAYTYAESIVGNNLDITLTALPVTWSATTTGLADGSGTWADKTASGSANFYVGGTNVQWDNTQPGVVTVGASSTGSGGVIALGSNITASAIVFAPVASPYTITGGTGSYSLFLTSGTGLTASNSAAVAANLMVTNNQSWTAASGQTLTVSGSIGEVTAGKSLTFNGPGTLVLSGSNTYSGGTAIAGGTLAAASDASLGNGGTVTLSGGTLGTAASFSSNRTIYISAASGLIDTTGGDLSLSGTISGNSGSILEKTGSGNLFLTGASPYIGNSVSSGLAVDAGHLVLAAPDGTNLTFSAETITVNAGAHLDIGTALNINSKGNTAINGSGDLEFLVSGASISEHSSGTLTINTGIVLNPNEVATSSAFFASIGSTTNVVVNSAISGDGSVYFAETTSGGSGTIDLNAQSTYTGNTIISNAKSGSVVLGISDALPTGTNLIFGYAGGPGGSFNLNGFNQTVASLATDPVTGTNVGGVVNTSTVASIFTVNSAIDSTYAGGIGTTSLNNNLALVKDGASTLTLSGTSLYSGATTINAGILAVSGTLSSTSGVIVNTGGTLGGSGTVSSSVTLAGGNLGMSGGTVGAVSVTADSSWSGSATAASLSIGSGNTLNLTGTATVASTLDVAGSTLVANGAVHATVQVDSTGTLKGNGTVDAILVDGGQVNPGNSPGTITSATTTWSSGTYVWEINALSSAQSGGAANGTAGNDPGWDLWNTGNLTVNSGFQIDVDSLTTSGNVAGSLGNWNPNASYQWLIATSSNDAFTPATVAALNSNLSWAQFHGYNTLDGSFSLVSSGDFGSLYLDYTAVPEPGTLALGTLAAGGLGWRIRRRKSAARDDS
ncbi:MAG TPA: autotransporter-associated beta strand repeat-containing protein [Pirellulales bacterium]|jgi:autotransporter-associated beta strand protein|nr:autotransporter-associated beta strand repeat-containing protein [Pirellulales bacterium]